jgi:hypothetical protein
MMDVMLTVICGKLGVVEEVLIPKGYYNLKSW